MLSSVVNSETALWITGGAGVLGALIGGAVTGGLTLLGEKNRQKFAAWMEEQRNERQDEERARAVRAAARVLRHLLLSKSHPVEVSVEQGCWWPSTTTVAVDFPAREWRLLAGSMTTEAWANVERAERRLRAADEGREHFPEHGSKGSDDLPGLDAKMRQTLRETVTVVTAGIEALRAFEAT
jgi:hypothetical protein